VQRQTRHFIPLNILTNGEWGNDQGPICEKSKLSENTHPAKQT
jgi:hypothetical protein